MLEQRGLDYVTTARAKGLDEKQITFRHVVRNALRFTRAGTVVQIDVAVRQHVLNIEVADRGPGASDALLKAMFEPFVRGVAGGESAGHGLGLAIAQRAMAAHGGAISARRREGGGLVVCLSLPASE